MLELKPAGHPPAESAAPPASSLLHPQGTPGVRSEADRVYGEIFDAVMDRRLLPGARLPEARLCAVFACSRATARAALAQLAHDKIVVIEPNRGATVWQPSARETRDVFAMRQALEGLVLDTLCARDDRVQALAPLYAMVDREQQAYEQGDRISWIRLSNAFHVELARLLDNQVLTEFLHSLCARTTLIIAYHDTPNSSTCSYIEHRQVLQRIAAGDAPGARAAMHHHLHDCEQRVSQGGTAQPDPWAAFPIPIPGA